MLGRFVYWWLDPKRQKHGAVFVYLANNIVNAIPFHGVRLGYYRYVMRFEIGDETSILMGTTFDKRSGLSIGRNSVINQCCRLDTRGGLTIGKNVSISNHVTVLSADHDGRAPGFKYREKPVIIADYAWVGTRATILPGVTIARGAIVAAGAVVSRDVGPLQIVAGIPAKPIGTRPESALDYTIRHRPPLR